MGREQKGVHLMEDEEKDELTRRGFVVLAASAFGAFFIKPPLVATSGDRDYLVSIQTIGYGYLWPEEDEDDDFMFEADSAEIQREALEPGSILYFRQDPDIPKDSAWLDVVASDGEKLCDIPWRGTPEEESAVMRIVEKINDGYEVWAEVTDAEHDTMNAGPDRARVHNIEFDVFCR